MANANHMTALLAKLPSFHSGTLAFDGGAKDVPEVVDRLGQIAALKAVLKIYEDALKTIVVDNGERAVEGRFYRAILTEGGEIVALDTKAIREAQGDKWCKKFEKVTQRGPSVSVKARLGTHLDEAVGSAA